MSITQEEKCMNRGILMSLSAMLLTAGAACAQKTETQRERQSDSAATAAKNQMGTKDSIVGTTGTQALDVNTATKAELTAAGWGQYADTIIAARPYKTMDDLWQRRIVPREAYDKGWKNFKVVEGTMDKPVQKSMETKPTAYPENRAPGSAAPVPQ